MEMATITKTLPPDLQSALRRVPDTVLGRTQEIRLRAGCPLTLSLPYGDHTVPSYLCTGERLVSTFEYLCEFSVHSHQEEIRRGYISTKTGCRVGLAGTAVMQNGRVVSMRNITSLCIRVKRSHENCAVSLVRTAAGKGRLKSVLICGEPASGKTSLLRDCALSLATARDVPKAYRMAVIDERGELLIPSQVPCDVLTGWPKAQGIEQALRTLAPEGVVFDELGDTAEVAAVLQCLNSGVSALATIHARDMAELKKRPVGRAALASGVFECVAFLCGRQNPGEIRRIVSVGDVAL